MTYLLKIKQAYPLEMKIQHSLKVVDEAIKKFGVGGMYVSFSGGKDSTVLLHLIRSKYPEIQAVFSNTGLEFPEIVKFARKTENCTFVFPKMNFKRVLEKYGYPIVSKEQACYIDQFRTTKSDYLRKVRWEGRDGHTQRYGKISEKWKYLVDAPFKISDRCCYVLKKSPLKAFEKKTKKIPFIGTMADESSIRAINWAKYGCNMFSLKRPISAPLSFWTEKDIWEYIEKFSVPYCDIYNKGYERTGCCFCLFGLNMEKGENRIERLKKTHEKLHDYCINKLGFKEVLEWYPKKELNK